MSVSSRLGALREAIEAAECDALLVTSLVNVRYLTGFTGSAGMLLVTATDALLVSDGRYREQAREQIAAAETDVEIEIGKAGEQLDAIDRVAKGIGRLGLEANDISWASKRRLPAALGQFTSGGGVLVATQSLVERLRVVKDEGELARSSVFQAGC